MEVDFRKSSWGHTLHDFHPLPPPKPKPFQYFRKLFGTNKTSEPDNRKRYRLMCHSRVDLSVGDTIVYLAQSGERRAIIMKCERCSDPTDMYTIEVAVERAPESLLTTPA